MKCFQVSQIFFIFFHVYLGKTKKDQYFFEPNLPPPVLWKFNAKFLTNLKPLNNFALLFDDIPDNFYELNGTKLNEGQMHAELANSLSSYLKKPIYVVPRIYADQLIMGNNKYLIDYFSSY